MASAQAGAAGLVPDEVATAITERRPRRVAEVALVRSVARIDFLWASDHVYVNEINTIPGSLAWYFWAGEGLGVRRPAGGHARRGSGGAPTADTRPMAPTARR